MVRKELSDFERGTVIGCHLCHKSVREISALIDVRRSTVSAIIVKWKRLGATTAWPRSGRPHKLAEWGRRVLKRVARKNRLALTTEYQTASGSTISTRTVCRELHFHGQSAAHKPHITMRNANAHGFRMEWPTSSYRCDGQVSTDFWPYSVSIHCSLKC